MKIISLFKKITQSSFYIKLTQSSLGKGIKKGLSIPTLPPKIEKYYNLLFVRIFRFIGGITVVLVVTRYHLNLPEYLHLSIAILASVQMLSIVIIFLIKIFYGLYIFLYKKEIFEVRN